MKFSAMGKSCFTTSQQRATLDNFKKLDLRVLRIVYHPSALYDLYSF